MDNPAQARKVGLFGFVGLVIVAALLVSFSRGAAFWKPRYEITVKAEGVGGLKPGAFVMMSGVPIGTVKQLELDASGARVLIDCLIESRFEVHSDARVEIEQSGFLGDQYVSITPTGNKTALLRDGGSVIAAKPFNMNEAVRSAVTLMQRLEGAAGRLDSAMARIDTGLLSTGTLSEITNTVANARRVSERADAAIREVQEVIRGNAPGIQGSISNVHRFTGHLNEVAGQLDALLLQAGGVVSNADSLITGNRQDVHAIVASVREAASDLKDLTHELQSGKGPAGLLLKDPVTQSRVQEIVGNFTVLSSNLSRHGILWKPRDVMPLTNNLKYSGRMPFR